MALELKPASGPYGRVVRAASAASDEIVRRARKQSQIEQGAFIVNALCILVSSHARALRMIDRDLHTQFCNAVIEHLAFDAAQLEQMMGDDVPEDRRPS